MLETVIAFYFAAPYTASIALAVVLDGCCLWSLRSPADPADPADPASIQLVAIQT